MAEEQSIIIDTLFFNLCRELVVLVSRKNLIDKTTTKIVLKSHAPFAPNQKSNSFSLTEICLNFCLGRLSIFFLILTSSNFHIEFFALMPKNKG